ncbi:MAG: ATP-binding protein [Syntrophobacteraceae bacterium]
MEDPQFDCNSCETYSLSQQEIGVLNSLSTKSFFELDPPSQETAKILTKNDPNCQTPIIDLYTFAINPLVLKNNLKKGMDHFIAFVDAEESDCYADVKNILQEYSDQINIYSVTGGADFIIDLWAPSSFIDTFRSVINKKSGTTVSINVFKVELYHIYWRQILNGGPVFKAKDKLTTSYIAQLESLHSNYLGISDSQLILAEMEKNKLLLSYYVLYDFTLCKRIRQYIALTNTSPEFISDLLTHDSLPENIINLFNVEKHGKLSKEFSGISYIMVTEFDSLTAYHQWKENLYSYAKSTHRRTNVFTFDIESRLSEISFSLGNHRAYQELTTKYSLPNVKDKIPLGSPIHFLTGAEDHTVDCCLDLNTIHEHGIICGGQGSGKSSTALFLASKVSEAGKPVHIFDMTGSMEPKFIAGEVPIITSYEIVKNIDVDFSSLNMQSKVYIHIVREEDLQVLADGLETYIKSKDDGKKVNGYRSAIECLFMFEEAHSFFSNAYFTKKIWQILQFAWRKGSGIWMASQKLSQFPIDKDPIYNEVNNIIIHRLSEEEELDKSLEKLLRQPNDASRRLYSITSEIRELQPGEAFVSFVTNVGGKKEFLAPVKIKVQIK